MTGSGHLGAIVVTSSTPLWYATRATGLVALVLLTAQHGARPAVLGALPAAGLAPVRHLGLHRNLSLLALGVHGVHVLTTVLDSFVSIPLQDAFIPFIASYRPLWVGFGAIAFDLMLALIVHEPAAHQDGPAQLAASCTGPPTCAGRSRCCTGSAPARTRRSAGCWCSPPPACWRSRG